MAKYARLIFEIEVKDGETKDMITKTMDKHLTDMMIDYPSYKWSWTVDDKSHFDRIP